MKGTLLHNGYYWIVRYNVATKRGMNDKPIIQEIVVSREVNDMLNEAFNNKFTRDVDFEIVEDKELCNCACHHDSGIVHFVACCNNGYIVTEYAKLKLAPDTLTWKDVSDLWGESDMQNPTQDRIFEWLKLNFNPPTKL